MGRRLNEIRDKKGVIKLKDFSMPYEKGHGKIGVAIFEWKDKEGKKQEFWLGRKQLNKVNKRIRIIEGGN